MYDITADYLNLIEDAEKAAAWHFDAAIKLLRLRFRSLRSDL
jgi:hypothetical protein